MDFNLADATIALVVVGSAGDNRPSVLPVWMDMCGDFFSRLHMPNYNDCIRSFDHNRTNRGIIKRLDKVGQGKDSVCHFHPAKLIHQVIKLYFLLFIIRFWNLLSPALSSTGEGAKDKAAEIE